MDHVVFVDSKANELERILNGSKRMILRGAAGRKLPYGRVVKEDVLYLIENDGSGLVKAKCAVKYVFNSEKMSKDESSKLVEENQDKLQLSDQQFKRWAGKRYIVLIGIADVSEIDTFHIDRSSYGNMDDWLLVENIENVKQ